MSGNRGLRRLALAAAWAALPAAAPAAARFSLPLVDVVPSVINQPASIAIWSATDSYITPGVAVLISFPAGTQFTIAPEPGINTSTANTWAFMKFTESVNGSFSPGEVTITGGSMFITGTAISVSMPAAVYPGPFYIRFDKTFSGIRNPLLTGTAQLLMYDPSGEAMRSQGYLVSPINVTTVTDAFGTGSISGTVRDTTGTAVAGALIMASSYGGPTFHPLSAGPRAPVSLAPALMAPGKDIFTTASGADGGFFLNVPAGSYDVVTRAWRVTMTAATPLTPSVAVLQYRTSLTTTVTVSAGAVTVYTPADATPPGIDPF